MLPRKKFFYIRHGQTDWNLAGRWQGHTDIALNDTGRQQAHDAAPRVATLPITHLYSSPLSRAKETADIVNKSLNLPLIMNAGLKEVGFGILEGKQDDMGAYTKKWREENYTPEGAESYHIFTDRIVATVSAILNLDGTPLIVAHGGAFWPIQETLNLTVEGNLPNATPLCVEPTEQGWDWYPV